jgi:hypothetical protein
MQLTSLAMLAAVCLPEISWRPNLHYTADSAFSATISIIPTLLGREMPSFLILEIRLVLGNPSRVAAPSGPPITQPVARNVSKIIDRVQSLNAPGAEVRALVL